MWSSLWTRFQDTLSILNWLPAYTQEAARSDAAAGLTVGVMLIPQGMAYAMIAGMPPIYGLYAALVPLLVYPLFATSRHLAVGPTAIDMLIVGTGLGAVAQAGTDRYLLLAVVLTAMVGAIQIGMGLAKFGFVANLLSRPVVAGLTTAAAFIISFSQLGTLLGVDLPRSQFVYVQLRQALQHIGEVHMLSLGVGAACIAVLVGLPRWQPLLPEALVVAVGATLASWFYGFAEAGVTVVGDIPGGLPAPTLAVPSAGDLRALLPTAGTLALVQFLNVITLGRTFAARHGYAIDANRELIGIGAANLAGGIFRSVPISGSFSRSAVNDQAGASTPLANVFTAVIIALALLFLTPLVYHLPMPALAAIIIVSGVGLVDLSEVRALFRARRRDGAIALFTTACTLIVGIQEGIILGIAASMVAVLYRISRPNLAELGHVPGTRLFRDRDRFPHAVRIQDMMILRVDAAFSFANAEYFKDFLLEKGESEGRNVRVVILDGTSINALDTTAIRALKSTVEALEAQGIELHLSGLIGPVREVVRRSGLHDLMGERSFHMDPHDAVVSILARWDREDGGDRVARYFASTEPENKAATPAAS
jgi:SulP family sulfate permease